MMNILAVLLLWLHDSGYRRASRAAQLIVEQILDDALVEESDDTKAPGPVKTRVVLKQQKTNVQA